jgi:hypothetical protein
VVGAKGPAAVVAGEGKVFILAAQVALQRFGDGVRGII